MDLLCLRFCFHFFLFCINLSLIFFYRELKDFLMPVCVGDLSLLLCLGFHKLNHVFLSKKFILYLTV